MMNKNLLFELILVALGVKDSINHVPTTEEWRYLYEEAVKQSLGKQSFRSSHEILESA